MFLRGQWSAAQRHPQRCNEQHANFSPAIACYLQHRYIALILNMTILKQLWKSLSSFLPV
jgi:hypothetical protein